MVLKTSLNQPFHLHHWIPSVFPQLLTYFLCQFLIFPGQRKVHQFHVLRWWPDTGMIMVPGQLATAREKVFFEKIHFFKGEHKWGGRAEGGSEGGVRDRERESSAVSMPSMDPNLGLDLTTMRSWPEPKSKVGCLTTEPSRCPKIHSSPDILALIRGMECQEWN